MQPIHYSSLVLFSVMALSVASCRDKGHPKRLSSKNKTTSLSPASDPMTKQKKPLASASAGIVAGPATAASNQSSKVMSHNASTSLGYSSPSTYAPSQAFTLPVSNNVPVPLSNQGGAKQVEKSMEAGEEGKPILGNGDGAKQAEENRPKPAPRTIMQIDKKQQPQEAAECPLFAGQPTPFSNWRKNIRKTLAANQEETQQAKIEDAKLVLDDLRNRQLEAEIVQDEQERDRSRDETFKKKQLQAQREDCEKEGELNQTRFNEMYAKINELNTKLTNIDQTMNARIDKGELDKKFVRGKERIKKFRLYIDLSTCYALINSYKQDLAECTNTLSKFRKNPIPEYKEILQLKADIKQFGNKINRLDGEINEFSERVEETISDIPDSSGILKKI